MRNFKKFLTLVLAVMMVVSAMSFTTSAATQFTDVDAAENAYLAKSVSLLNYMGVAKGVSDTEFGSTQNVTREQFALFIYRLMKGGKDAPATGSNTTRFTDLEDPTYFYAVSWANAQGIVNGRNSTTFDPKGGITLQEAYTMVVRALGYEKDGETLAYPFGYIEKAEDDKVALDEGLASDIDYTDVLTRGDMAIILYNSFFAETGVAEIVNKEHELSNKEIVLVQVEEYPTLCEKVFDVKEVEYQAIATPHYALGNEKVTNDLGYDAILFQRKDDDVNVKAPDLAYIAAEDISIDADKLDDYFLAHFTMFVTLDDDNEIDSVLFADSNMSKKTVNDLKFATVTSNKADSYYENTDAKLLSGKATTGTETIYFFNAPYSYANPTYGTKMTNAAKYIARNEENIEMISFEISDDDKGYYSAAVEGIVTSTPEEWEDKEYTETADSYATQEKELLAKNATELADTFAQAYYGGLYEADIYDVDGDGIYDYIDYKPYTLFQVNTDDDYTFSDDYAEDEGVADGALTGNAEIPVIYTNEATLLGEKFADEDYVLGYYSKDTNTIKVAQVIKPVTTKVKSVKTNTSTITFTDGTTAKVDGAWKLVSNYAPTETAYDVEDYKFTEFDDDLLTASVIDNDEIDFYVYDGVVLYQEGADTKALKFTNNLIIPLDYPLQTQYDSKIGDMVTYMTAIVDGKKKVVPIVTEDIYPDIRDNFDTKYVGKLCTYSIDADGLYTIDSLGYKTNENGDYKGVNLVEDKLKDDKDDSIQWYTELGNNVKMTKIAGTRFKIDGVTPYVVLKSYSKIVIMNDNTATGEIEYLEYDIDRFTETPDVDLNNVSLILSNDPDSTSRENLVVLYAEATDFELKGASTTSGYRIVSASTPGVDENGYYRNYYDILNPFTGNKEFDVAGSASASKSDSLADPKNPGTVIKLKDGKVDDKSGAATYGNINLDTYAGLVWISEYDSADKVLEVVPVAATGKWQDVDNYTFAGETNIDGEEEFIATESGNLLYQVDANTVVTMIKGSRSDDLFKWGSISLLDASTLASTNNTYKCYNSKDTDSKGNYKTSYAKYIKAYITFTESKDESELPTVDYVVILVHDNEEPEFLSTFKDE